MRRVAAAFVLLALLYPLGAFVMRREFGLGGALTVGSIPFAAIVVVGVPVFALFLRRGWLQGWQFALGGGVIGIACTLPFAIGGSALVTGLAPAFAGFGILNGWVFWVLAVWRNERLIPKPRGVGTGEK